MLRRKAETADRVVMLLRRVSLVTGDAVAGIFFLKQKAGVIPRDLGKDRGGGDARRKQIPLDDRPYRVGEPPRLIAVDKNEIRRRIEQCDRPPHGKQRGIQNVDLVDLRGGRLGDAVGDGVFYDHVKKGFALCLTRMPALGTNQKHNSFLDIRQTTR